MGTRIAKGWAYTLDAMRMLGAAGYPKRPSYQQRLEDSVTEVCARAECGALDVTALRALVDESEHSGQYARLFPPSSAEELEYTRAFSAPVASRRDVLSQHLAASFYGDSESEARGALLQPQEAGEEDTRRWDWFGVEGNWRKEKAAVRQENRAVMQSIRTARNYQEQ